MTAAMVCVKWSILGDLVGLRCFVLLLGADAAATLLIVGVSSKSLQSTASQVKEEVGQPTLNATPAIAVGLPFHPLATVLHALRQDIDEWHRSNGKLHGIVKSDSSRISYCCRGVDKMCTFDLKYISPKVGGINVRHRVIQPSSLIVEPKFPSKNPYRYPLLHLLWRTILHFLQYLIKKSRITFRTDQRYYKIMINKQA